MLRLTWVYKYLFETLLSVILGKYPEVEFLDCMVILLLVFWGTAILFSTGAAHFTFPPTVPSHFFTASPTLVIFWVFSFFDSSHPNGYVLVSLCGFGLLFAINSWILSYRVRIGHLCIFEEDAYEVLCPFFDWLFDLLLSCKSSLYVVGINPLLDIWFTDILCYSIKHVLWCMEELFNSNFDVI